jgi:hypothetical protein
MTTKKRIRGNPIPLIIENHPDDYDGYPFITLLQYRNNQLLSIIDNVTDKYVKSYVLDYCGPASVDEEQIISVATNWYTEYKDKYPISFAFSRLGISNDVSKIYRSLNIEFITRVIGPLPRFEMSEIHSIKRRRRKAIPSGMEIHKKLLKEV